jgi:hypothetical protein
LYKLVRIEKNALFTDNMYSSVRREDPKMVLNGTFPNTRPEGRPRTRWVDVLKRNALQLLGIRGWRRRAENMDEWRRLLKEAKARKEL